MSEIKVNSIKGVGATTAAITVNNTDGTCTANLTNRTNKNLIINGAMQIAQRGTSSTSTGYKTVDRFGISAGGQDNAMTQAQADVTSGGAYNSGFRKCLKITNANQTGGAGAADYYRIYQFIEAQNAAQSGWNYVSSSSNISLSFWVKSSVAQNFYGYLRTQDSTQQNYPFETGSLTADTWTKITKTIPGNSNITIDNDINHGLALFIDLYNGTDYTGSVTLNQWGVYNSSIRVPDYGTANDDWYLTNGATFEITGVQIEVGSNATDFEHLSFADDLLKCQRYFYKTGDIGTSEEWFPGVQTHADHGNFTVPSFNSSTNRAAPSLRFPVLMRVSGTATYYPGRNDVTNTVDRVNEYTNNTNESYGYAPAPSCGGLEYYFQDITGGGADAYVFQCTVDAEL
tara:strand:+ start:1028 stop:2227 length:1200 start_codon:yes stop_codon:yes gene_type:complete